MGAASKRQKTQTANIQPKSYLTCTSGVASMLWASPSSLIVGGTDHQLKIYDIERQQMSESILTQFKVPTAMDGDDQVLLTGQEDGVVKLYDLRESNAGGARRYRVASEFIGHTRSIS